jgi:hypothetical protein
MSKGGGASLPAQTQQQMGSAMGADFSGVKVHTGSEAAGLSNSIGAQAFTHGNDVYFNEGKYNPSTTEGSKLLAHELTHTVQQGAAVRRKTDDETINRSSVKTQNPAVRALAQTPDLQREGEPSLLGRAWNATGGRLVDAAGAAIEFGENLFWEAVEHYGGAGLVSVLRQIQREGIANFFKSKIMQAVNSIFNGLQNQSGRLAAIYPQFGQLMAQMRSIGAALVSGDCQPLFSAIGELREIASQIAGEAWDSIVTFFQPAIDFFTGIWEDIGAPIISWIQEKAGHVWSWMQSIGQNIWNWFAPVRNALGAAWDWLKRLIGLNAEETGEEGLIQWAQRKIGEVWAEVQVQIEPIIAPMREMVNRIREVIPLDKIMNLRRTIQEWLSHVVETATAMGNDASNIQNEAQQVSLRDQIIPAVQRSIERFKGRLTEAAVWVNGKIGGIYNAVSDFFNTVRGISLVRGAAQVLNWVETRASEVNQWAQNTVTNLFDMIGEGLTRLGQFLRPVLDTLQRIADVASDFLGVLPDIILGPGWRAIPQCIKDPIQQFLIQQILGRMPFFQQLQAVANIWEQIQSAALLILRQVFVDGNFRGALWTFFSSMLNIIGIPPQLVTSIISKAAQNFLEILENPLNVLVNFVRALKLGFEQFFGNFGTHLLGGLQGWLFGQLEDAGLQPPTDFSFRSILQFVFQVMGITVDMILGVIERVFPERPNLRRRIEQVIGVISNAWAWFERLMSQDTEGGDVWSRLESAVGNIWEQVLDSVAGWLQTNIVQRAITWVATHLNPTVLAVISTIVDVFNVLQTLAGQARAILQIIDHVLDGIADFIHGIIAAAANIFENALARMIPVAIAFLANLLGLSGISRVIRLAVEALQERVERGVESFIRRMRAWVERLMGAARDAVQAVRGFFGIRNSFTTDTGERHSVYFENRNGRSVVIVESVPRAIEEFLTFYESEYSISPSSPKATIISNIRTHLTSYEVEYAELRRLGEDSDAAQPVHARLLQKNVILSGYLRTLMSGNRTVGEIIDSYALEGLTGTYASIPKPPNDILTGDHQPQAAILKWAAGLPISQGNNRLLFRAGSEMQRRASGTHASHGYAINLHELRHTHPLARTYGTRGNVTLNRFINLVQSRLNNASDEPAMRHIIVEQMKLDLADDASAMLTVINQTDAWTDIDELQITTNEKNTLKNGIKNRIRQGEQELRNQPMDVLKNG